MFSENSAFDGRSRSIIEQFGEHLPGGFVIFEDSGDGVLRYANMSICAIFGCSTMEDFKAHTGLTFRGMVHPEDYDSVMASIDEQLDGAQPEIDLVSYRIIRQDGEIRWVESYGQYVKTGNGSDEGTADGEGLHYMFISDVTEKHQKTESDKALRAAVIEALTRVYDSVWLIDDIETQHFELFRIDDEMHHILPAREAVRITKYPEALAFYSELVLEEDRQRFLEAVTPDKIIRNTADRLMYSVPYRRVFEDAVRHYRLEFAKLDLGEGTIGIVVGFKDVDEEVRKEQQIQQTLDLRAAVIEALTRVYDSVWLIDDIETQHFELFRIDDEMHHLLPAREAVRITKYSEALAFYSELVLEEDRQRFLEAVTPDKVLANTADRLVYSVPFRRMFDDAVRHYRLEFAKLDLGEGSIGIVGGFKDVDEEVRKEQQVQQALQEAIEAANASSKAKSDFLASMSHDMHTPMNGIIGMTAVASKHLDDKERVADCLRKISDSSAHLLTLIDEVLDMSKIEAGNMELHEEEFNLAELIDGVLATVNPQMQARGHSFSANVSGVDHELVTGDSRRIEQTFVSIMDNAIKYTPDGGTISLSICENPTGIQGFSHYQFVFEDNGSGMTEEFQKRLFEPFTRADDQRVTNVQGTGLGMAIARNLVRMMGGDISVESVYGQGSKFTVNLYLKHQDAGDIDRRSFAGLRVLIADADHECCASACEILNDMGMTCEWVLSGDDAANRVESKREQGQAYHVVIVDWGLPDTGGADAVRRICGPDGGDGPVVVVSAYDLAEIEQPTREAGANAFIGKPMFRTKLAGLFSSLVGSGAGEPTHGAPAKTLDELDLSGRAILLAEDNELNAEIALSLLEITGAEVDWARDGAQAVEMLAGSPDGHYSLIIMDLRMPNMTGIEAAKAIRAMERSDAKTVPIVAMTANAFAEDVLKCKNAGMNEHVKKPIDVDVLARVLDAYVS